MPISDRALDCRDCATFERYRRDRVMLFALTKIALAILDEFYSDPLPMFYEEKDPQNYFSYEHFTVRSFRGLETVQLDFAKNDLTLLLGLNESGKTTILKAIETFDFNNDPPPERVKQFFTSMRNKQDIECSQPCVISASIAFSEPLDFNFFKKFLRLPILAQPIGPRLSNSRAEQMKRARLSSLGSSPFQTDPPERRITSWMVRYSTAHGWAVYWRKRSYDAVHLYCISRILKIRSQIGFIQSLKITHTMHLGTKLLMAFSITQMLLIRLRSSRLIMQKQILERMTPGRY